jgi:trehalose-phosphatase
VRPAAGRAATAEEIALAARRPAAARAFILDIDGTLAPIVDDPRASRVPEGVLATLDRLLRSGWRVAIATGRSAADARRMVPLPGVAIFGSHGLEREGASRIPLRAREAALRAERIARLTRDWASELRHVRVELKPFGCAFHHRALDPGERSHFTRWLRAWLADCDMRGLELVAGKRLIELRPAGFGKELVARRWAPARSARRGDRSLVAIGDDWSDEALFAALRDRGLSIRVGDARRASHARRRLPSTAAVARLLASISS